MNAPISAFRTVLSKYATFTGRASRPEFWWWFVAVLILVLITRVIDGVLIGPLLGLGVFGPNAGQPLSLILSLGLIIPNIAVGVRRLHDIGKSGWWILIGLVPLLGLLILIYFYIQPSNEGSNEFGAPQPFHAG